MQQSLPCRPPRQHRRQDCRFSRTACMWLQPCWCVVLAGTVLRCACVAARLVADDDAASTGHLLHPVELSLGGAGTGARVLRHKRGALAKMFSGQGCFAVCMLGATATTEIALRCGCKLAHLTQCFVQVGLSEMPAVLLITCICPVSVGSCCPLCADLQRSHSCCQGGACQGAATGHCRMPCGWCSCCMTHAAVSRQVALGAVCVCRACNCPK